MGTNLDIKYPSKLMENIQQPTSSEEYSGNTHKRLKMGFKNFAFVALAIAAQSLAAPENLRWNELLGSRHTIFPSEFDSIQSKSLNIPVVMAELRNALEQTTIFDTVYKNYLAFYRKDMNRFESVQHRNIFKKTLLNMATHNLEAQKGIKTWTVGVNKFSDMTKSEASVFLGGIPQAPTRRSNVSHMSLKPFRDISWKDTATPVKSQGNCSSCYAFGAVGFLEHMYSINNGVKLDLSEQQVVDCDSKAFGCNSGDAYYSLEYLKNGVALESDYPYEAKQKECGKAPLAGPVVKDIFDGSSEADLVDFLNQGPVMINVEVDEAFRDYTGGIVKACAGTILGGHSLIVVAMGTEDGQQYYDVKNSWGADRGEAGYWRMAAGVNCCNLGIRPVRITSN